MLHLGIIDRSFITDQSTARYQQGTCKLHKNGKLRESAGCENREVCPFLYGKVLYATEISGHVPGKAEFGNHTVECVYFFKPGVHQERLTVCCNSKGNTREAGSRPKVSIASTRCGGDFPKPYQRVLDMKKLTVFPCIDSRKIGHHIFLNNQIKML